MGVRAFSFPRLPLFQGFSVVPRRLVYLELTPRRPVKTPRSVLIIKKNTFLFVFWACLGGVLGVFIMYI